MSQEFLRYKGRPLVRSGDTLYYGSMGDKCVAHLQIKSNKQNHGLNMADKVVIQLISTDETLPLKDRMLNKAERDGLYEALSIASIWMDRHNKKRAVKSFFKDNKTPSAMDRGLHNKIVITELLSN